MKNYQKILRPKFYGKTMPAYAALGPDFCPLSFFSEKMFWEIRKIENLNLMKNCQKLVKFI